MNIFCAMDGTVAAAWIQDLILAGAACIAFIQLRDFNRNERIKNTLQYIHRFLTDTYTYHPGGTMSLQDAYGFVTTQNYVAISGQLARFDSGAVGGDRAPWDLAQLKFSGAAIALYNYFCPGDLFKSDAIDKDLFFSQHANTVVRTYACTKGALKESNVNPIYLNQYLVFAKEAQEYVRKRGDHQGVTDIELN